MRLFSFDFENMLVWFILFFGGCVSQSPPQPVEIETPKSIATQVIGSENLIIEIENEQTVSFTFKGHDGNLIKRKVRNEPAALEIVIKEASDNVGGKEKLDIVLKSPANSKHKIYSKVISALKANEIYQFKLVTTAE